MSTPKKEIKPEPTKAPRKRTAPKKAQRVAEVESEENVTHTIAPVNTTVTVSEPEHIALPQVEEEVKQRAVGVWGKIKAWWGKWGWIPVLAILATAILFIYLYVQSGKSNKAAKETQQTEQQQQGARDRLQRSEANLSEMQQHRVLDSLINKNLTEAAYLMQDHIRFEERMAEENVKLKKSNDVLQDKIRNGNDDTLRSAGHVLTRQ